MPAIRLTQVAVDRLAPPASGRIIHWDRHLPGFGLRVTAKGAKSWVAMYRVGGKPVMETIGSLARIPKVDDARQRARDSMARAAAGEHPVELRKAAAKKAADNTVAGAVVAYLKHCDRNLKPKTAREWRRIFEHDVLPRWGARPLAEITKGDVLELIDDKAARRERKRTGATGGAAVQAGKMLARLRTFFGWAIANDLVGADPTAGARRPAKDGQRDRVLSDAEIRLFWASCDRLGYPFGPLFKVLLLTAQRDGSEVSGIRWSEIDRNNAQWEIPGSRTKNGKPHVVHLSELAAEVLDAVPRIAGQDLVFSHAGTKPLSGFSRAKARLDQAMLTESRAGTTPLEAERIQLAPWVLHDLRRTATTGMARLGIAPHVADRVLNHQAGTIRGVARVYNRFQYLDERKSALEAWGRYVERLVRPVPSNVVQLATGT